MHCGDAKTGSSSIQSALLSSCEKLKNSGILYHSLNRFGHFDLSYIVGKRHRVEPSQDTIILDRAKQVIYEIKELAKKNNPKVVLLSSEYFFRYNQEEIEKTINSLELAFTSIDCIIYIRSPSDYYLSETQQTLKASHLIKNPLTYNRDIVTPLQRWKNIVGEENLHLSVYHKSNFADVVDHFRQTLEKISTEKVDFNDYTTVNHSLSAEQMIILQNYRNEYFVNYNYQLRPESSNLIRFFEHINNLKYIGTRPSLRNEIRDHILHINKNQILGIDAISRSNSFSSLCNLPTENQFNFESNQSITSVKDILCSYNEDVLRCFLDLIIEYNPRPESLEKFAGHFMGVTKIKALKCYYNYLKSGKYLNDDQISRFENLNSKGWEKALMSFLDSKT
jgi:hypothetical protein